MESSGHLPDARQVSCDRTNDPESSTCPPVGGRDDEGIERVDTDEDDPMTSQLKTQISVWDRVEGRSHDISYGLPPHDTSVGNFQECSHEMGTADVEQDAHPIYHSL